MLPRQGEMFENTPFTRKCTSEPSELLRENLGSFREWTIEPITHVLNCQMVLLEISTI